MKSSCVAIIILLIGAGCGPGVVTTRPIAETTVAPASPGPTYIWVNDSWDWDTHSHLYVVRPGYWVEPKQSAVWVDGRWVKTKNGWKYKNGYWKYK